jgi:hydrogenase maturation protein HypF
VGHPPWRRVPWQRTLLKSWHEGWGARGVMPMHSAYDLLPDRATCDACLAELRDPDGRRHRHAFVSCSECGPRWSVTRQPLARCEACEHEYADPAGRRHGYAATCCPVCGPHLRLITPTEPDRHDEAALTEARAVLAEGGVLAVKTVGGYRLACDATNGPAVAMLRKRLLRGDEPFATMVTSVDDAQHLVRLGPAESALLGDAARPVVLAPRRTGALAAAVAPGQGDLGVMLAAEPLHHLLLGLRGDIGGPSALVLTGGRVGDEPVVTDDHEALVRLDGIADAWLTHGREVSLPTDDSVVRGLAGDPVLVRAARGHTPLRLPLPFVAPPVLATGGDVTGAVALAEGREAWLSGHLGDLAEPATRRAFDATVTCLTRLTAISPATVATDAGATWVPRWAGDWLGDHSRPTVHEVQHHHAHVASTMAEHGLPDGRRVIGVVLDGPAPGDEGTTWGGEVLLADYRGYERVSHLGEVDLPAGDPQPFRVALAHLRAAGIPWDPSLPSVRACDDHELGRVDVQLTDPAQRVTTSSMVRLVEAVASLTGICHRTDYSGQALAELEARARPFGLGDLRRRTRIYAFGEDGDPTPVVWSVVQDIRKGVDPDLVAARFQHAVVDFVAAAVRQAHETSRIQTVTLSGSLFDNPFLAAECFTRLCAERFEVLAHRRVPAGEGGLALGQLAVLAHRA